MGATQPCRVIKLLNYLLITECVNNEKKKNDEHELEHVGDFLCARAMQRGRQGKNKYKLTERKKERKKYIETNEV